MREFELIERLRGRLAEAGAAAGRRVAVPTGDDAAVIEHGTTAVSVDAVVEGVHFTRATTSLEAVGRKALAAALSDLAAVGAGPGEALVALGVSPDLDEGDCDDLLDGLVGGAREWSVALVGGDVVAAPALFVSVTVLGPLEGAAVTRAGAGPGDILAVTGALGSAAAGLAVLERPELAAAVPDGIAKALRERQRRPVPLLDAGRALAAAGATAMIDLSDGIAGDAKHLARESGARIVVELERLPLAEGAREVASAAGRDPVDLAVSGGEDYELLVCLPPEELSAAVEALGRVGTALTAIGAVEDGPPGVELREADGRTREATGYDQLGG
jgi:thiamine-monophosphate kinase